jgi:hypothetical protein
MKVLSLNNFYKHRTAIFDPDPSLKIFAGVVMCPSQVSEFVKLVVEPVPVLLNLFHSSATNFKKFTVLHHGECLACIWLLVPKASLVGNHLLIAVLTPHCS